jgi:8-oxo-dGTP pyrophosphatase MutT (NUDIX family)
MDAGVTGETGAARRYRQVVPRPPWARPGGRAPWAPAEPGANPSRPLRLETARTQLEAVLDPAEAELDRPPNAAVLLALFETPADDETQLVLIRRSPHLARNPGEIAFPGGRIEKGEAPLVAALRETEEEIGLAPSDVEVIGRLRLIERPRAPVAIVPFVGIVRHVPTWTPSAGEVDEVIVVPVAALLSEGVFWEELWNPAGIEPIAIPFYSDYKLLGDDLIWGASARMLTDLLTRIGPAAGWEP